MSKYTFSQCAESVIREYTGIWNGATYEVNCRALRRVSLYVDDLHSHGQMKHLDPHDIDMYDVKAFVIFLKEERHLSPSSIEKELGFFQKVCLSCGNDCVRFARAKWPYLVPKSSKGGRAILSDFHLRSIIEYVSSLEIHERGDVMPVVVALATGARINEIRNMKVEDFDLSIPCVRIMVPKGMASYGRKRLVPVRPELLPFVSEWLSYIEFGYVFPNRFTGGLLSINALEEDRRSVCSDLGFFFDYRQCRSTYGQLLKDEGFPIDIVSVILGHSSSRVTETFYARVRNVSALEDVVSKWYSESDQNMCSGQPSSASAKISERGGIRTLGLQLRRLPPYPG